MKKLLLICSFVLLTSCSTSPVVEIGDADFSELTEVEPLEETTTETISEPSEELSYSNRIPWHNLNELKLGGGSRLIEPIQVISTHGLNAEAAFGDITWKGRMVEGENEYRGQVRSDEGGFIPGTKIDPMQIYQLIRVDADNIETTVLEFGLGGYSDVEWTFSNGGKNFVMKAIRAGGHDATITEIGFIEGEEVYRAGYESHKVAIMFETPNSPTYTMTYVTSEACIGEASYSDDWGLLNPQETELLGLRISWDDDSEIFELPEPQKIPCGMYDMSFIDSPPEDIQTNVYGTYFRLPTWEMVGLSIDKNTHEVDVRFLPASNY